MPVRACQDAIVEDPYWKLSFDGELFVYVFVPEDSAWGFQLRAFFLTHNATVDAAKRVAKTDNVAKHFGDFLTTFVQALNYVFNEDWALDSTVGRFSDPWHYPDTVQTVSVKALTDQVAQWTQSLPAATKFGFRNIDAFVNTTNGTLNLRLTHPGDMGPQAKNDPPNLVKSLLACVSNFAFNRHASLKDRPSWITRWECSGTGGVGAQGADMKSVGGVSLPVMATLGCYHQTGKPGCFVNNGPLRN